MKVRGHQRITGSLDTDASCQCHASNAGESPAWKRSRPSYAFLHQNDSLNTDTSCQCHPQNPDESHTRKRSSYVLLHRNGFQKEISPDVLIIPKLQRGSRNGFVHSQEDKKSHQGNKDLNLVPSSCEMVTECEKASVKNEPCDGTVAIRNDSKLPQDKCRCRHDASTSVAHCCSANKSQLPVNRKQQCQSTVGLASSSALPSVCSESVECKWNNCGCKISSDMLLEHIRIKHVATQVRFSGDNIVNAEEQSFVCLWTGCKVYNRPSCLLTWLERHIVSHLGDKPYCCIVAGCGARFASEAMLQRHVNAHFSGNCSTSLAVSRSLRKSDSAVKLTKKRRPRSARPYPATSQDFFDARIMEAIRKQLSVFSAGHNTNCDVSGNGIAFQHAVLARRVDGSGQSEVLIQWTTPDLLSEELLLSCGVHRKALPLSCLRELFAKPAKHFVRKKTLL